MKRSRLYYLILHGLLLILIGIFGVGSTVYAKTENNSVKEKEKCIKLINKTFSIKVNPECGVFADYDGDGDKELFISYADKDEEDIKTFFCDGKIAKQMDGRLYADFYSEYNENQFFTEECLKFDKENVYLANSKDHNGWGQVAYTVYKNKPVGLIPKDLEMSYDGTRLIIEDGENYLLGYGNIKVYKKNHKDSSVIELSEQRVPAYYCEGKLYQLESKEITVKKALKDKKLNDLLPEIEKKLVKVKNVGAGLGDGYGTIDVKISGKDIKINNILYNEAGYYIINYLCKISELQYYGEKGYEYIEMYAKVDMNDGDYFIAEVGGGNMTPTVTGFDVREYD